MTGGSEIANPISLLFHDLHNEALLFICSWVGDPVSSV